LISGGPGAEPVPPDGQVDAADAEMKLTALPGPGSGARMAEAGRERLGRKLQKNGGCLEEVDVYVLDTIPSCEHLQTAYQQWWQNGSNEWIAILLVGLLPCYEGRDELHSNHLHVYYTEQDQEIEIKAHEYYMADHGFFIAG